MRSILLLGALGGLLAGCASDAVTYAGQPQAVAQAMAKCRAGSDQVAASSMGQGAMFAAAMQQQYINDCMAAAGHPAQD